MAGRDSFAAHWPLDATHTVGQTLTSRHRNLSGASIVLVPYRGQPQGTITLSVKNEAGQEVARSSLPASTIKDDTAASFPLPVIRRIAGQQLRLDLTSDHPEAHVGVRFEPNEDAILHGTALRNGQLAPGDLALKISRRTNMYGRLVDNLRARPELLHLSLTAAMTGLVMAGLAWWAKSPRRLFLAACLIIILILPWRLLIVPEVRGESGGDAYNFLFIMQRIQQHGQWYHPQEKRLPAWPLVLLPTTLVTNDTLTAARVINQLIAASTLSLLVVIGLQLKLPPAAVLFAVMLTAFNRDFLFTSFRPLAYPLTGLLSLGSLCLIFWARSRPSYVMFAGLLLGAAGQTRQEALLAGAAVVTVAGGVWLYEKKWRTALALFLPWLVVVAPYFIANAVMFGNPLYSGYLDHPVTNPRLSAGEIKEHFELAWAVVSSTWWPAWRQQMRIESNSFTVLSFLAAIFLGLVVPALSRRIPRLKTVFEIVAAPALVVAALATAQLLVAKPLTVHTNSTIWLVMLSGLGALVLLDRALQQLKPLNTTSLNDTGGGKIALVTIMALSLFIIATWVHPVEKTYFSFWPYLGLTAGLGLSTIIAALAERSRPKAPSLSRFMCTALVVAIAAFPLLHSAITFPAAIDYANRKNIPDYLLYEAARALSTETGRVALRHESLPAIYYLSERVIRFPETEAEPSPQELARHDVRWLIWFSNDPLFNSYAEKPDVYPVFFSAHGETNDDELLEVRVLQLR